VQEGGLIVANADCGQQSLCGFIPQLGEQLFSRLRVSAPCRRNIRSSRRDVPRQIGKENSGIEAWAIRARELMLLFSAEDPSRAWQTLPLVIRGSTASCRARALSHRRQSLLLLDRSAGLVRDRRRPGSFRRSPRKKKLTVARLSTMALGPRTVRLESIANRLRKQMKMELELPARSSWADALDTARSGIAYLTGTAKLQFTDSSAADLKRCAYEGGLLIVDAAAAPPNSQPPPRMN